MAYTEIHQLPPPPQFMLDELEREESKYLGELLSKVLTIREARPIRNALRQKLQVHPIVRGIRESTKQQIGYESSNPLLAEIKFYGAPCPHLCFALNPDTIYFREFEELIKNKKGKNKGKHNMKKGDLLYFLMDVWNKKTELMTIDNNEQRVNQLDKMLRIGFCKWLETNFHLLKNKPKGEWRYNI